MELILEDGKDLPSASRKKSNGKLLPRQTGDL